MDIDRSLDEIIKQNRSGKTKPKQNGGGAPARGGRGGKRGGGRGGGGGGRGGGRVANGRKGSFQNGDSFNKKIANGMKNKPARTPVRKLESVSTGRKQHNAIARPQVQGSGTLQVSNLHFTVSDSDVKDLFGEIGKIKKSHLHYDQSGRSLGTADVTYERRSDAIKAMKQYNRVPLDGKAMKIELATPTGQQQDFGGQIRSHLAVKQSGIKFNYKNVANGGGVRGVSGGGVVKKKGKVAGRGGKVVAAGGKVRGGAGKVKGGKVRGGGKIAGGGKVKNGVAKGLKKKVPKEVKKAPTAEELDKEMDDYQNGRS